MLQRMRYVPTLVRATAGSRPAAVLCACVLHPHLLGDEALQQIVVQGQLLQPLILLCGRWGCQKTSMAPGIPTAGAAGSQQGSQCSQQMALTWAVVFSSVICSLPEGASTAYQQISFSTCMDTVPRVSTHASTMVVHAVACAQPWSKVTAGLCTGCHWAGSARMEGVS